MSELVVPGRGVTRAHIEKYIESLIELLDHIDGDADFEGEEPEAAEGLEYYRLPPRYGVDQTKGPINYVEIRRAYLADLARAA